MDVYDYLNEEWKKTCKLVLGGEIGELKDFQQYLMREVERSGLVKQRSCSRSHKRLQIFLDFYPDSAAFIDNTLLQHTKITPLSINEIKDIDSIMEAWREKLLYKGNVVLGNSSHIQESDTVFDSHYVLSSAGISNATNVAYSVWIRDGSKNVFGVIGGPEVKYSIKSYYGYKLTRGFEVHTFANVTDAYFSHYVISSREVMFSFVQIGKAYVIGNNTLPKDKYFALKHALLEQIRDELSKNKTLPTLMDLIASPERPRTQCKRVQQRKELFNFEIVDQGFKKTTQLLLNHSFSLNELKHWLAHGRVVPVKNVRTVFCNNGEYYNVKVVTFDNDLSNRVVELEEIPLLNTLTLQHDEMTSLSSIFNNLKHIGVLCQKMEFADEQLGGNTNTAEVAVRAGAVNAFRVYDVTHGKHQAYNYLSCPHSSYTYGSTFVTHSSFVINSVKGYKITRALECDNCEYSSDVYFAHDINNCSEVMFSQHLRNKRYVIGNNTLPKDKYFALKRKLLAELVEKLT